MKLTVLGSGTFFVSPDQTASSFLLEINNKKILIDCGPGTLYRLSQLNIKPEDLDYVFLTHFHPDHSSDLFPLFMSVRLNDLFSPGSVTKFPEFYGPVGLDQFMLDYSNLTELKAVENWDKIKFNEYQDSHQLDNIVVKSFKVVHEAFRFPTRAYSLRFEAEGKIITFSGDCANCQGIKDATRDSDLFICDASFPAGMKGNVHMDTIDIGEICHDSQVKKVLLTHFYPQFEKTDFVAEVQKNFSGEVSCCHDQMEIIL
jgi:ribonuclease BN (tRNA processing enzyme)